MNPAAPRCAIAILLLTAGCAARGGATSPPPPTVGPITSQPEAAPPAVATDPAFPERRGVTPEVQDFPVYPGATVVGSAARNRRRCRRGTDSTDIPRRKEPAWRSRRGRVQGGDRDHRHARAEASRDNKRTFMTMLFDKRVDVIFQGHEHGYERSKQLATNKATCPIVPTNTVNTGCIVDSDDELVKGAGTVIHVLGTGGKDMRSLEEGDSERQYFVDRFAHSGIEAFGFGQFTVTPTRLSYAFVRSAGATFTDTFTIAGSGSPE